MAETTLCVRRTSLRRARGRDFAARLRNARQQRVASGGLRQRGDSVVGSSDASPANSAIAERRSTFGAFARLRRSRVSSGRLGHRGRRRHLHPGGRHWRRCRRGEPAARRPRAGSGSARPVATACASTEAVEWSRRSSSSASRTRNCSCDRARSSSPTWCSATSRRSNDDARLRSSSWTCFANASRAARASASASSSAVDAGAADCLARCARPARRGGRTPLA